MRAMIYSKTWYAGGQEITLPAALEELPLLARAGSVIPMSNRIAHVDADKETLRKFLVFPHKGTGQRHISIFDDDGLTTGYLNDLYLQLNIILSSDLSRIDLTISREGKWKPAYEDIAFVLPESEQRDLYVNGQLVTSSKVVRLSELV
ncbi:hypothetical protein DN730_07715 [Marinomonas piezotolerans]|uniref:DUF5110 domain-containing protein n=2 Tax=Marinomonas piezotolerans TaxID=2213058 RepID=A0A370U967_9GAMM|nr:hypothetical protein DN730_07715 [Marinomonas piezotolerans]